jgi:hypothetical protein
MPRDPNHRFARDARESATLATLALGEPDEDVAREAIAILHYRSTPLEFELARELASDREPARRSLAADIMGQIGWDERAFLEESVDILLNLLDDSDSVVVAHAATALGFRNHPRAIPALLRHLADIGCRVCGSSESTGGAPHGQDSRIYVLVHRNLEAPQQGSAGELCLDRRRHGHSDSRWHRGQGCYVWPLIVSVAERRFQSSRNSRLRLKQPNDGSRHEHELDRRRCEPREGRRGE